MFNFLNSTVLFAAAAALIPLLIHLFSRRRLKVVEFSSLKHLQAMQKRQVRRLKIRQLLLLMLRMLIILAVVLAFARPTTTGGSVGTHASVSAVVLMDNSASMNRQVADGNLFDLARARTDRLLETFGDADEVAIVPLCARAETPASTIFSSAAVASELLARLTAGHSRADLERGLEAARRLLDQADNPNKEIYLVTDRQQVSLPETPQLAESDAHIYLIELPLSGYDNCGLTALDFGGQLLVPGHDFDITATVKNHGSNDRQDIIASLFLDGHRVAQSDVEVKAGHETSVRFTRNLARGGFHGGYVELSDDHYPGDNRYFFSFRIPDRFNVLIVDGDGAGQFMALALAPSENVGQYWSVKQAAPEQLSQIDVTDYHVIILSGAPELNSTYVSRLKSFVRNGRAMFVTYNGTTDIDEFNRQWSEIAGVAFDEAAPTSFSRAGYYTMASFDVEHPVFSVFGLEENKPPEIKFFALPRPRVAGDADVLATFSGNRPALVQSTYGSGTVLTFTGALLPQYSDITGHAFFVPFISRLVEYLASDLSSYDLHLHSGQTISRTLSLSGAVGASLELVAPDSSVYNIPPEEDKGNLVVTPQPTDLPGIYRISYLGREIDRFAVNIDPREGDLTATEVDQFATAIGAADMHVLDERANLATAVAELRFGKELWHLFLWAAVIMLAIEMLLARSSSTQE